MIKTHQDKLQRRSTPRRAGSRHGSLTHGCHTRNHNLRPWGGLGAPLAATAPPVQPESRYEGIDKAHQDTGGSCPGAPARWHRGSSSPGLAGGQGPAAALRTPGPPQPRHRPRDPRSPPGRCPPCPRPHSFLLPLPGHGCGAGPGTHGPGAAPGRPHPGNPP